MTQMAVSPQRMSHKTPRARILGIGTANPPAVTQESSLELALELGCFDSTQQSWIKRLYNRSEIQTRCSVLASENQIDQLSRPREFYPAAKDASDRGPTTATRMQRYAIEAPPLAIQSAQAALGNAGVQPEQITHLITVSCTGFFAPGLDAVLIKALHLPGTVQRIQIGFMGCHAAFNALATAQAISNANRNAQVLICCVELCSLHFAYGFDPSKLVANSLFADGSASAVVGQSEADDSSDLHIDSFSSCLLSDSADAMTWNIGDHGFEMTLSPGVPQIIRAQLAPWCEAWLAKQNLKITDIAGWAIHPGGPKILSAVAQALSLDPFHLQYSKDILRRCGNMSSTTVLFILQQMAQSVSGPVVAIGLGPGLIAEGMLLNKQSLAII